MRLTTLGIVSLLALSLTACGGSEDPEGSDPSAIAPTSSAAPPKANATQGTSACKDAEGDGGPVDLRSVSLTVGDDVTVTAKLADGFPLTDTAMVGINVASADGNKSRQLAVKWVEGEAPGPFVFDMGSAKQENLPVSALLVDGNIVTMIFPASAVDDLGDGWTWGAFTTAAGADVDACPSEVGGMEMEPFA